MKTKVKLGLAAATGCLIVPILSRLPKGVEWVAQYRPDEGHFIGGILFFGGFALIPAVVVFVAFLVSREPRFFPGLFATAAAYATLIYLHHDNDLAADAQAALTLVFIPLFVAFIAALCAGAGLLVQAFAGNRGKEARDEKPGGSE